MHSKESIQVYEKVGLGDLEKVVQQLVDQLKMTRIWLFFGEMGSGKTTLIKAICQFLGVVDTVSSPTFSIVNEYSNKEGEKIYHFDFYRLKNEAEAYEIGTDEYFHSGCYCFVEWPEKIPTLIPQSYASITLRLDDIQQRTIAIAVYDGQEENRF